jgi:BlaI family penicillinase repressor
MKKEAIIKPTESELEILNILWEKGPSTVKEVHEQLAATKNVGYTTTLKIMQIMLDKQLVTRDASSKIHVYQSAVDKTQAQGQMVQRLIETVFNGSAMQLVMQALGNHSATNDELDMIKEYLDKKAKNKGK